MGKFASSKTSKASRPSARGGSESATKDAVTTAKSSSSSALFKKTAFKAKAKQPVKIALQAVKKHQQAIREPEVKPAPFAPAVVLDTVPDKKPEAAAATTAGRHITKKEKIQNRHDNLMRKFDNVLEARRSVQMKAKAARKEQQRQKQKVAQVVKEVLSVTDLSSLKNALPALNDELPSLNSLFQLKSGAGGALRTGVPKFDALAKKKAAREAKEAAAAKAKGEGGAVDAVPKKLSKTTKTLNKKNEFMERYNYFQKLSEDKAFKRNPREVIAAHIRNRAAAEAAE